MKNFLLNIFAPSVDSITSSLQRTVSKLEAHAAREAEKSNQLSEQAVTFDLLADKSAAESLRASATARRIAGLLG